MRALVALLGLALAGCAGIAPPEPPIGPIVEGGPPLVVLASGSAAYELPRPGVDATRHLVPFDVPANATVLTVYHNKTFNGVWGATAYVVRPDGSEAANTLDACSVGISQAGLSSQARCVVVVEPPGKLTAGPWRLRLSWVIGEANEEGTLSWVVHGVR